MDTTPTRHSPNAVLMLDQRLRRWPNINRHWVRVQCLLGEPSCQYMRGGQLFRAPRSNTTVSFQTQCLTKSIGGIISS